MKREFLKGLGLSDEAIDKIMAENGSDIENAKKKAVENSDLSKQVETLNGQLADRDKDIEQLKKDAGDNKELKETIEKMQKANESKDNELMISHAVEIALMKASVHSAKAVMPFLDLENAELKDGEVVGLDKQIKSLQEDEDKKWLFKAEEKSTLKGVKPGEGRDGGEDKPKAATLADAIRNQYEGDNKGE